MSNRAPFASDPNKARPRLYAEAESPPRTPFQRDRDRIIHSSAFRRLKYKTQVFVYHEGDQYRTRLTHSIEVAQIARSIARVLGLDEDLAEALALAHDLGHPPFGHAGEDALEACMQAYDGFDHNGQSLKLVTQLEQRYAAFDGLNLTWDTLEGLVKHNGPLTGALASPKNLQKPLPLAIAEYIARHDLEVHTFAGPEAQVAALSDDIAYNNHDIDDGLRAGLFTIDELRSVPVVDQVFAAVLDFYPKLDTKRLVHESVRRLISLMIDDVVAETRRRVALHKPDSADAVRALDTPLVSFSTGMAAQEALLKRFLFQRMYRHYKVNRMTLKARRTVMDLFTVLLTEPGVLPPEWAALTQGPKSKQTARVVCDYIAGMTDLFAFQEHRRLFDLSANE
ncbi:MAG TPA: deoxyguanosinetriphosphate triphosphohydrolase [Alphaproteobacteria bacterium]|nr:deoxyguanosinetriphosphate triphosphohydrolase [Alphaproteobacteria bacterium]